MFNNGNKAILIFLYFNGITIVPGHKSLMTDLPNAKCTKTCQPLELLNVSRIILRYPVKMDNIKGTVPPRSQRLVLTKQEN